MLSAVEKAPNIALHSPFIGTLHFRYVSKDSDCSSDISVWMAVVSDCTLFVYFDGLYSYVYMV